MVVCYLSATLCCDDKFRTCNDKFRTKSFCRRPFFIMHVIIFTYFSCMMNCHHKLKRISTSTTCHVHLHSKSKLLICTSSGGAFCYLWRQYLYPLRFHILLSPLKTSTSLSSITKKGEIVSASSATPSWFWSIDDKPGWGTNVFVRIAG